MAPWLSTAARSATPSARLHVLLDEHDGAAVVGGDAPHGVEERLDDERGQAHAHLVDEQHLRLLDERPGHGEHLLLAAGERRRPCSFQRFSRAGNTSSMSRGDGPALAAPRPEVLLHA